MMMMSELRAHLAVPAAGLRARIGARPGDGGAERARQVVAHGHAAHARAPQRKRQPRHVRSHLRTALRASRALALEVQGNHCITEEMFKRVTYHRVMWHHLQATGLMGQKQPCSLKP